MVSTQSKKSMVSSAHTKKSLVNTTSSKKVGFSTARSKKAKRSGAITVHYKRPHISTSHFKLPGIVELPTAVIIAQVCCGESHTVIRGQTGKVYGWGANEMGQLGIQKRKLVSCPLEIRRSLTLLHCERTFQYSPCE